ncbi:hypothetical protein [Xylanimonas sp. McL0601]|uniref:hypothetical protein n=1 Tax=Xylanimonas sp. McL0601 TaxID=3414739 RepID=UPI003CF4C204
MFGRWIKKHLPPEKLVFTPHRAGPFGLDRSDVRGPMPLDALQVGRVCACCNNGWMSNLEDDAERILFGADRDLGAGDAHRLAHWAVKTAVVINLSQPSPLIWAEADRHRVQSGPFSRTAVSVLRVDGADIDWAQGEGSSWLTDGSGPTVTAALGAMVTTARIRLNDIVLVVAHLPWQMAACSVSLPGHMIWDGRSAHPVSLDALPLASSLYEGSIHIDGTVATSFWAQPALDFWRSAIRVTEVITSSAG